VFNETTDKSTQARLRSCLKETRTTATLSRMEHQLSHPWRKLHLIAHEFHAESPIPTAHTPDWFKSLTEWLLEYVRMTRLWYAPEKSKHEPADDWIIPGVSAIKFLYGILEVVQAAWRLCESVKEILKKSNNKWKHKLQVKTVELCTVAAQDCHLGITGLVDSWINALKGRGVQNILVQVRWGPTGAALRQLINDSQQRQYAQDTVDSAVETLQGLKMVKLK
jgi:N-terminal acetyltransferase B complex non-catalytic subunit